jgi:hypothetical protein
VRNSTLTSALFNRTKPRQKCPNRYTVFRFRQTFDSVDHNLIIEKLQFFGVKGMVLIWFRDYLNNRTQRVVMEGVCSGWTHVTSGVPQGPQHTGTFAVCYFHKRYFECCATDNKSCAIC